MQHFSLGAEKEEEERERALFADIGTALGRDAHIRSFLIASPPPREDGSAAYPPLRWRRMFRMDFFFAKVVSQASRFLFLANQRNVIQYLVIFF